MQENSETKKEEIAKTDEEFKNEQLRPLREAASHIASLLCSLSADRELFVSDADTPNLRKLDTKALKEFSAVLKELSSVICELNGITPETSDVPDTVRIEFDEAGKVLSV